MIVAAMSRMRWHHKLPESLKRMASVFQENGYQCFLVGGSVRDLLLGRALADYDIATNATPEEVRSVFRRVIPTGIRHGTVTVLFRGDQYEVTTYRRDGKYTDGRHPDTVTFSSSILEDLGRRDFTINGMAYDLISRNLLDPHGGRDDLKSHTVRAIGDPEERFLEDGLRPLRACRFAAQLGFRIEACTEQAIEKASHRIRLISAERIRDELVKIVQADDMVRGFELLAATGLLAVILPEMQACIGVEQGDLHRYDVFHHSLHTCAAAPQDNLTLRLAALFHDIGKAAAKGRSESGEIHFHRHEGYSAESAKRILKRLKFPNAEAERVSHIIRHHMFNYQEAWTDAAIRRFIARVGKENIPLVIDLRLADQGGAGISRGRGNRALLQFIERLEAVAREDNALSIKDLEIDGEQLMSKLQLEPGPQVGVILRFLLEAVIDDPALNTYEKLAEMAERFYRERLR